VINYPRVIDMVEERKCKKCGITGGQYKRGTTPKGNVRYSCKQCGKWYVEAESGYSAEFKRESIQLYLEGNSGRAVGRLKKIGKNTIWNWLREYEENLPKSEEGDVEIIEQDELYTYIKKGKSSVFDNDGGEGRP